MGKINSIQFLRGLAAIAVVIFHATVRVAVPGVSFTVGAIGVDIFFIISGFIMWVTTTDAAISPGAFLLHRAIRIMPLYWLITVTISVVAVIAPPLFPHLNPDFSHVVLSLAFIPHTAPDGTALPVLPPGWTLNYEMFFYVLFAAALAFGKQWRAPVLTLVFIVLFVIGLVVAPHSPVLSACTNARILEFIAGMWLGKAWMARRLPSAGASLSLVVLGVAVLIVFSATRACEQHSWNDIFWGVPSLLIVTGFLSLEAAGKFPHWRLFTLLGDASYSIYLLHHLTIAAVFRSGGKALPPMIQIPVYILVSALVGCIFYLRVEKPMTTRLRSMAASLLVTRK